jgi:hypothetical protein
MRVAITAWATLRSQLTTSSCHVYSSHVLPSPQVLSCFSQQLHEVWAAFFYGNTGIVLPTGGGGQTDLIPSPWARSATTDAPAPCSLFVCLPVSSYLSSTHSMFMVGTSTVFRHFLVQTFNFAQWHLNYMCHAAVTS